MGGISGILVVKAGCLTVQGEEVELTLACCGRLFILWERC